MFYGCCRTTVHHVHWQYCLPRDCSQISETHAFDMEECDGCAFMRERMEARDRRLALQVDEQEMERIMAGLRMEEVKTEGDNNVEVEKEDRNVERMMGTLRISERGEAERGAGSG